MSEKQSIRKSHDPFTAIPLLYDDVKLTILEHRLLCHYSRVAGSYESVRTTARRCHISPVSVTKGRESLADLGWIIVGENDKGTIQVEIVDVWAIDGAIYGGTIKRPHAWVAKFSSVTDLARGLETLQIQHATVTDLARERDRSGTKEDPLEVDPSRKNPRDVLRKHAETVFRTITKLNPPKRKGEAGTRWWSPLREICELAAWQEQRITLLIRAAVAYMDHNKLNYDAPQSILKTVRSMDAKLRRGNLNVNEYLTGEDKFALLLEGIEL